MSLTQSEWKCVTTLLEHKMNVDIDPGGFPYSAEHIQFLTPGISFKACCNRAYLGCL